MKNFSITVLLILIGVNSHSQTLTQWEAEIEIPESVYRVKQAKNNKSVEYEVAAYEAAIDLLKIAAANEKLGNNMKSLKFLALAAHLFPYRDDIVNKLKGTIISYVEETNNLIVSKRIECDDLKNRVSFISSISPKEAEKITNNESCLYKKNNMILTLDQIDVMQWIDQSKTFKNIVFNEDFSSHGTEEDLFLQAQKIKKEKEEYAKRSKVVYELKFPKAEILINSMKVLGQFSFIVNNPSIKTINTSDVIVTGEYISNNTSQFTFEGLCRTLKPYFELPPRQLGSTYNIGQRTCGYEDTRGRYIHRYVSGDWSFLNFRFSIMPNTANYISDDPKAETPLFRFLPRVLDMDVVYIYENGDRILKDFQVQIKDTIDFFGWLYFPELIDTTFGFKKPEVINNKAHIVFLKNNRFAIPVVDLTILKGLKRIEIAFNSEKTFKRMANLLDVKLKY